jgi:hypothetical protein
MSLTRRDDAFNFLGAGVIQHDNGTTELLQKGLIEKVLKTMGMKDAKQKKTPAGHVPLGTDAQGDPFHEDWKYSSVIGMMLYLFSNS